LISSSIHTKHTFMSQSRSQHQLPVTNNGKTFSSSFLLFFELPLITGLAVILVNTSLHNPWFLLPLRFLLLPTKFLSCSFISSSIHLLYFISRGKNNQKLNLTLLHFNPTSLVILRNCPFRSKDFVLQPWKLGKEISHFAEQFESCHYSAQSIRKSRWHSK